MRKSLAVLALVLAVAASPLQAGQFMIGIGVGTLLEDGVDLQLSYRPEQSHWMVGYRFVRWSEASDFPYSFGDPLTKTTTTMSGPIATYLFKPELRTTWYVGGSALKASRTEKAFLTGEEGSDSTTALFFGGGVLGSIGRTGYFNLGLFLSPGSKLGTRTSVSSTEERGLLDGQFQLGMRF